MWQVTEPFLKFEDDLTNLIAHPRGAGARTMSMRIAREEGVPLMFTLSQLSYWSAEHLGKAGVTQMNERGRVQEGMIADITIFNAETVADRASFEEGTQSLPPAGIPYVLVSGHVVVDNHEAKKIGEAGVAIRYPVEESRFEPVPEHAAKWIEYDWRDDEAAN